MQTQILMDVLDLCESVVDTLQSYYILETVEPICYVAISSNKNDIADVTMSYCNDIKDAKARIHNVVDGKDSITSSISHDNFKTHSRNYITFEDNKVSYAIITGYKECNEYITSIIQQQKETPQVIRNKYISDICSNVFTKLSIKGEDISFFVNSKGIHFTNSRFPDLNLV